MIIRSLIDHFLSFILQIPFYIFYLLISLQNYNISGYIYLRFSSVQLKFNSVLFFLYQKLWFLESLRLEFLCLVSPNIPTFIMFSFLLMYYSLHSFITFYLWSQDGCLLASLSVLADNKINYVPNSAVLFSQKVIFEFLPSCGLKTNSGKMEPQFIPVSFLRKRNLEGPNLCCHHTPRIQTVKCLWMVLFLIRYLIYITGSSKQMLKNTTFSVLQ